MPNKKHSFYRVSYPRLLLYLWVEDIICSLFRVNWVLVIMVDHKQKNFRFGRILTCIKDKLPSRLFKRAALIAHAAIVTMRQWVRNSMVFWYRNVNDKKLILKHRSFEAFARTPSQHSKLNE